MDPKITTFPGLYIYSTIINKLFDFLYIFMNDINLNDDTSNLIIIATNITPYLLRNSSLIIGFLCSFHYSMKCRQLVSLLYIYIRVYYY